MPAQDLVEQAIVDTLVNDSTIAGLVAGRIYRAVAPRETAYPLITYSLHGSKDRYVFTKRSATTYYYLVKAIDKNDSALNALTISEQIDFLLDRKPLTLSGSTAQNVIARDSLVSYPEPFADQTFWHEGGVYRIDVQA